MSLRENLQWLAGHPVARRHPARTGYRWFYWQIRQRFTKRPKIMNFINGSRLAIYPGEGLTGYWYVNLPDFEELSFLAQHLASDSVFYDVGANAGAFAVFAASHGCRVFAFEPVPHSFKRLEENAGLNRPMLSITPVQEAVAASPGNLLMTTGFGPGNHVVGDHDSPDAIEVICTTLDEFSGQNPAPHFIKLDVEGHELEVLKGAVKTLANPGLRGLLVETFRSSNWKLPKHQELERLLRSFGFVPCHPNLSGPIEMSEDNEGGNNTFYLRLEHFTS